MDLENGVSPGDLVNETEVLMALLFVGIFIYFFIRFAIVAVKIAWFFGTVPDRGERGNQM